MEMVNRNSYEPYVDVDDIEVFAAPRDGSQRQNIVNDRILKVALLRKWQQHKNQYILILILLLIIIFQSLCMVYFASRKVGCEITEVKFEKGSHGSEHNDDTAVDVDEMDVMENTDDGKEHQCGFPDCDLTDLKLKKLKSYSLCNCFSNMTVSRVFSTLSGDAGYGIEFKVKYSDGYQDYDEYDWKIFNKIKTRFSGRYQLIQASDGMYLIWHKLKYQN